MDQKADKAIGAFDGTGHIAYKGDNRLGKLELMSAGVRDLDQSRYLRLLGNGDGFLNKSELVDAQKQGLITISEEGKIALTEKGKSQVKPGA